MTAGAYLLAMVEVLVFVAALGVAGNRFRTWWLPTWSGAIARLADVVVAITLAVLLGEVLGSIGLLEELLLLIGALVLAGIAWRVQPAWLDQERERHLRISPGWAFAAGALVVALVFLRWWTETLQILDVGMWNYDTMQYHMPLAAGFAQASSVTALHFFDPSYMSWFDPANSELLHAEGIVLTGRDILSPLMNLGWVSLAMLAAWCIGKPYGRAPITLLAIATLLVVPINLTRQPGEAMSDTAGLAALLCCIAILVTALDSKPGPRGRLTFEAWRPLVLAALSAGLAVGFKANLILAVGVLGIGAVLISVRGFRLRAAGIWIAGVLLAGGFWYFRNLVAVGNPMPWFGIDLGPLSIPSTTESIDAFDGPLFQHYDVPQLPIFFGHFWWLLLGLGAVGAVAAVATRSTPLQLVLGITAITAAVAYGLSPATAPGIGERPPTPLPINPRFLVPALAIGLVLLSTLPIARLKGVTIALAVLFGATFVVNIDPGPTLQDAYVGGAVVLGLGILITLGLARARSLGRVGTLDATLYGAALAGVGVVLFWSQAQQYLEKRYSTPVWPEMAASFRWAKDVSGARIAVGGTEGGAFQYAYYGDDVSNRVIYLGVRGERGSFGPITSCERWRSALNDGGFDYVVTTPAIRYPVRTSAGILTTGYSPERSWTGPGPATTEILADGEIAVFRVNGPLQRAGCKDPRASFEGVPPVLRGVAKPIPPAD